MSVTSAAIIRVWIAIVVDDDHLVYTSDSTAHLAIGPHQEKERDDRLRMPHDPHQKHGEPVYGVGKSRRLDLRRPPTRTDLPFQAKRRPHGRSRKRLARESGSPGIGIDSRPVSLSAGNGKIYYGFLGESPPPRSSSLIPPPGGNGTWGR